MPIPLIVHERIGRWSRQLRPRLVNQPVRVVESRSLVDLSSEARRCSCPIIVVPFVEPITHGLEALELAAQTAPNALILVIDPFSTPDLAEIAREIGASHVISGPATPPAVVSILLRWIPLALSRVRSDGWAEDQRPEPDPYWAFLDSLAPSPIAIE